jgi:hypothetical protein
MLSVVTTPEAATVTALSQVPEAIAEVPSVAVPLAIVTADPVFEKYHFDPS